MCARRSGAPPGPALLPQGTVCPGCESCRRDSPSTQQPRPLTPCASPRAQLARDERVRTPLPRGLPRVPGHRPPLAFASQAGGQRPSPGVTPPVVAHVPGTVRTPLQALQVASRSTLHPAFALLSPQIAVRPRGAAPPPSPLRRPIPPPKQYKMAQVLSHLCDIGP